jgi:dTDP-4-dehydrorhamnose 3,5-epimerase
MNGPFKITQTPLNGPAIIERTVNRDARGYLERLFGVEELAGVIGRRAIRQINRTLTTSRGTVRGMHFQVPPHAEVKLVTCLRGSVFDVAVDIRENSPTFLRWHAEVLADSEHRTMLIPEGFAHGFQALTDNCELLYIHTAPYVRSAESGLNPSDPRLDITWPKEITEMSARDASWEFLTDEFIGIAT